jgi:hypothetical protein
MQVLKAGALYFVLVFGVGFVLGTVRVLWIVPRFGERTAELMEAPIMLGVTVLAAYGTGRYLAIPATPSKRLGLGFVALGLLLIAEFTMVLSLRGLSIAEYVATQDPVSGVVYLVMLTVFAMMPLLVARKSD